MKTTLELPDALVQEIKLQAIRRGQRWEDVVSELIRSGLGAADSVPASRSPPVVQRHAQSGLPILECAANARAENALTPECVAELLLQAEVAAHHEAGR